MNTEENNNQNDNQEVAAMNDFQLTDVQFDELEVLRKAYYEKLVELNVPSFDVYCTKVEDGEIFVNSFNSAQELANGSSNIPTIMRIFSRMVVDSNFCGFMNTACEYYDHGDERVSEAAMEEGKNEQKH